MKLVAEQLLKKFGIDHQIMKTVEELGECISAIAEFINESNEETEKHLLEEIADVEITFATMKLIFDDEKFKTIKKQKLIKAKTYLISNKGN